METNILELEILIEGFKLTCQTEGKSSKTIEWYTAFMKRFWLFLESNHLPTSVNSLNKTHIRAFIRYLQEEARTPRSQKPLSQSTVQGYVRTLKAFFSWAIREGYLETNTMSQIRVPRATHKVVNTFSQEHITRLLNQCRNSNGLGCRNLSIILLLLDSGLRVSELVGIDIDDLDLAEGNIRIRRAKGNKERIVPIGSLVQKSLWKYIINYRSRPLTTKVTRVFLSEAGVPLTKSGIQQILRRYGRKAGISGVRCSPHTFRHTFARTYLLNGGDIFSLQKILGHTSLASVRNYINLFAIDVKMQHRRFSPVDNIAQDHGLYSLLRSAI